MRIVDTPEFGHHLQRLKSATIQALTPREVGVWLCRNTFHSGKPFSFVNREYQERIVGDESQEIVVIKPSQVGVSELSARLTLAKVNLNRAFTTIYTLPTAGFAATFMRTRIDPVIEGSKYLSANIHNTTNNSEVKRFGDSYIWMRGAASDNAPISIPADMLVHDELDFCDPDILSQYHSRLSASPFKNKYKFSTPTTPDYGIDAEFKQSRRHFNFVKCNHCNHHFIPDYFEHVVIPEWSGDDMKTIKKSTLPSLKYMDAYVQCPSCRLKPSLQPEFREWVCENPSEMHVAAGYAISPFDAPNIITPRDLIKASTEYANYHDFMNFGLGKAMADKDGSITVEDCRDMLMEWDAPVTGQYVIGMDMGMTCHLVVMYVAGDSTRIIAYVEQIPVAQVRKRYMEVKRLYRVRVSVVDTQPYVETVIAMQGEDRNLFGAFYVNKKSLDLFAVRDVQDDEEKGRMSVRQVDINRNKMFDSVLTSVKEGKIFKKSDELDEIWTEQMTDMRKVKVLTQDKELTTEWRKSSQGNDHFHHATLYADVAANLMALNVGGRSLPFVASKISTKPRKK